MSALLKTSLFIKKLLLIVIAFLLPIKGVILAVGCAIMADTITGIIKAKKNNDEITSRKLSVVVSKMILYQSAIILFYIIEKFILADIVGLFTDLPFIVTKIVAITLISIELKSVNENYIAIKGYSLWTKFKDLLLRAKEVKDEIDSMTKKEE